ncbi:hypothetical protein [Pandoraea pnomenusa]|uniref:hypothetical protein n=1 Tax=Pandoraea pnomenusa TaxID=93220 RepID=UPI00333EC341
MAKPRDTPSIDLQTAYDPLTRSMKVVVIVVVVIAGLAVGAIALWITRKRFARSGPPEPMPIFAAGRT